MMFSDMLNKSKLKKWKIKKSPYKAGFLLDKRYFFKTSIIIFETDVNNIMKLKVPTLIE